uniref:Solute carrier family 43 member 3 n=2 Tax=Leptobrachium leishanense TaxID=445787 RepID=A0A8C5QP80_9ANUR
MELKMKFQHLLTLITGMIECMFFAGIAFGWASFVFILKHEKYFQDLCPYPGNQSRNATDGCPEQDEQFSQIFTVAIFLNSFMTFPFGFIFDKFGTAVTRSLAIFLYTMATLFIALSYADIATIMFPALFFLAAGGTLLLVTNMQVGNLFGSHRSTVITFLNGAFDSSSVMLLFVKLLYQIGVPLQTTFFCITSCCIAFLIRTLFLMPKAQIPYPLPERYRYGIRCAKSNTPVSLEITSLKDPSSQDQLGQKSINGIMHQEASDLSFWSCIRSSLFSLHVIWLSIIQLRLIMFIATLNPTLNRLSGGDLQIVSHYTNVFALSQFCGIICAPWNGMIMDRHKRKKKVSDSMADLRSSVLSLALTATQSTLFSIIAVIQTLPAMYAAFILQVLNRSFLYGGNAAFLSIAFPLQHFGKLYGLIMSLSALVLVLQYPALYIIRTYLKGDSFYVDIALLILGLLAFIHPISVFQLCKKKNVSRE